LMRLAEVAVGVVGVVGEAAMQVGGVGVVAEGQ